MTFEERAYEAEAQVERLQKERDELRAALRHAVQRNHAASDGCAGCAGILAALQQPEGEETKE